MPSKTKASVKKEKKIRNRAEECRHKPSNLLNKQRSHHAPSLYWICYGLSIVVCGMLTFHCAYLSNNVHAKTSLPTAHDPGRITGFFPGVMTPPHSCPRGQMTDLVGPILYECCLSLSLLARHGLSVCRHTYSTRSVTPPPNHTCTPNEHPSLLLKPLGAALRTHGTQGTLVNAIQRTTHKQHMDTHVDNPIERAILISQTAKTRVLTSSSPTAKPTKRTTDAFKSHWLDGSC